MSFLPKVCRFQLIASFPFRVLTTTIRLDPSVIGTFAGAQSQILKNISIRPINNYRGASCQGQQLRRQLPVICSCK